MRYSFLVSVAAVLLLAACSSPYAPQDNHPVPSAPKPTATAPANPTLGSPAWYAWVDHSLHIGDGQGHGPDPGSPEWNRAVQHKLGQEAPQSEPGSPQWQQSVDALLRARLPAGATTAM
ncbi:MAG TPA: hypothetical protein VFJ01_05640 [Oleiagrimonas sp.]|nr:hypothetical protein [Oleiagrimonas sp.]